MRYVLFLILVCLIVVGQAAAALPLGRPVTSCSADSFPDNPNASVIWVTYLSGHGDTFIDGKPLMPGGAKSLGGNDGWQFFVTPGTHSVRINRSGFREFSATVQVCDRKVTYVSYDQAPLVVTTATTIVPATTVTAVTVTTLPVSPATVLPTVPAAAGTTTQQDTLGSLTVTTIPPGAFIFIDGVQRGVTPATIPGLSAGTHTLLMQLDGYQDISTPVTIVAGKTQEYSSGMAKTTAPPTILVTAPAGTKKSPGFEAAAGIIVLAAILSLRKGSSR